MMDNKTDRRHTVVASKYAADGSLTSVKYRDFGDKHTATEWVNGTIKAYKETPPENGSTYKFRVVVTP